MTDITNSEDPSMEPGVMVPGASDGTEPIPSDGTEPIPSDGTEPIPSDGTEPIPSDGTEPIPSDGTEPIPSDGTEPGRTDGAELGQSDGMELGQSDGMELGQSAADGAEPGQTDSRLADELEQESRQMDESLDDATCMDVAIPLSSSSSDEDLAVTGASEQGGQEDHVAIATEEEPGGMVGLPDDPISMAVAVPLPSSSSDEDLTANRVSQQDGKEDSIPTSEPQTVSTQELSEHPAEKQPAENVSAALPPGPNPCVDKESPPPRPPTLPSRERAFTTNEDQLVPPKSVSPEKGRLSPLQPKPPRPPRPLMPMRQRTSSLPHRPVSNMCSES